MRRALLVAAALLASGPAPVAAQSGPGLGPGNEVGIVGSLRPAVSSAAGRALPLLGIGAALRLSPSFEAGGEGVLGLRRLPGGSGTEGEEDSEITLGYGGVRLQYLVSGEPREDHLSLGLLLGAGIARMHQPGTDAEVAAESFVVVEPALAYRRRFGSTVGGTASVGYRLTPGAEPLPGMAGGELTGIVASLELRLIRDP